MNSTELKLIFSDAKKAPVLYLKMRKGECDIFSYAAPYKRQWHVRGKFLSEGYIYVLTKDLGSVLTVIDKNSDLEIRIEDNNLILKDGAEYLTHCEDASEDVENTDLFALSYLSINPGEFGFIRHGARNVLPAVSADMIKPELCGISLTETGFGDDRLRIIGTDSRRMHVYETEFSFLKRFGISSVIMPRDFIEFEPLGEVGVAAILKEPTADEVELSALAFKFPYSENSDAVFQSYVVPGVVRDFAQVVPKDLPVSITIETRKFKTIVDKMRRLAAGRRTMPRVKMVQSGTDILLSTSHMNSVEKALIHGEFGGIAFDGRFMVDALSVISALPNTTIQCGGPMTPFVVQYGNLKAVMMPMVIKGDD